MPAIEKSILVHAPAQTAYALWPDFERFPEFMEEVDWVRRIDETHLLWRVNFTGEPCEWETEVPVRIPHTRTSWRSHSGFRSSSAVSFVDGEPGQRMITLGIIFDPGGRRHGSRGGGKLSRRPFGARFAALQSNGRDGGLRTVSAKIEMIEDPA